MKKIEKLKQAREILEAVENEYIEETGFCPYEIGHTLRNLNEAIESLAPSSD